MGRGFFRAGLGAGVLFTVVSGARADVLPPDDALDAQVVVVLREGYDAATFLQANPTYLGDVLGGGRAVLIHTGGAAAAAQVRDSLVADPNVLAAQINGTVNYVRTSFVPNDPYFPPNVPTLGDPGQWYLQNTVVPGRDARVQGAWDQNVIGTGVRIGIIDDGFDTAHADLASNYAAASSFDFGQNDADPSPVLSTDNHGTAMAGLVAATGGNGVGITGVAPGATWAGLRINFDAPTTAQFVDATLHESSGASQSIDIKLHTYATTTRFLNAAAEEAALATSTADGTIHVFAVGNNRSGVAQDANTKDLQNSQHAITVAAMASDGKYASYSAYGPNVFVTAPSNSPVAGMMPVLTTDRTGADGLNPSEDTFADQDYSLKVSGTSSAAAIVAGALALAKEAQPNLDTRMAKHLLAMTSDVIDAADASSTSDSGWQTNAAGFTFNPNYGFGLVDASELVQMAGQYSGVTPLQTETATVNTSFTVPDNTTTYSQLGLTMDSTTPLEEVLVTLDVTHLSRGQLEFELQSPEGTRRRLLNSHLSDTGDHLQWTLLSNAYWGEDPSGIWRLFVRDRQVGTVGTINSFEITLLMGELVVPEPASAVLFILGSIMMLRRNTRRRSEGD